MMDDRWENPIRRRRWESQPVFGCTITSPSLDTAARAAAGFHFLCSPHGIEPARRQQTLH
jgi:hypothetical protein